MAPTSMPNAYDVSHTLYAVDVHKMYVTSSCKLEFLFANLLVVIVYNSGYPGAFMSKSQ